MSDEQRVIKAIRARLDNIGEMLVRLGSLGDEGERGAVYQKLRALDAGVEKLDSKVYDRLYQTESRIFSRMAG